MAGVVPPDDTTGAVPVTEVTVPPLDGLVLVMVIDPAALVTDIPVPAVTVVLTKPTPVLPISICPFVGAVVRPVPPLATATVPVTFAAFPEILPLTCDPGKLNALNVVKVELLVAVMFAAVPVVFWFKVGTSPACMVLITTFVPLPLK